jgi:hypothetical protein
MQAGPHVRPRASHRLLAAALAGAVLAVTVSSAVAVAAPSPAPPPAKAGAKAGAPALAAKPARPVKPVKPVKLAKGTLEKLASKNDTDALSALDTLRLAGPAAVAAAPDIVALLDRGAHREVTIAALQTLGDLGPSDSVAAIVPYTGHRELAIRRAAVLALDGIHAHGEHAITALRRALGDADEEVRASAARGLAQPEAAPLAADLVKAMDHKVAHSGLALGVVCRGDTCVELAARLDNSVPEVEASAGLDRLVDRPDLPDETKARVLEKIGSAHSQAARVFLGSLKTGDRWPKSASPALTKARDAALNEASGVR